MAKSNAGGRREGAGRKKGYVALQAEKFRQEVVKQTMKELRPILKKALEQAKAGDAQARSWLIDRGFGKALESLAIVDPDDVLKTIFIEKSNDKNSNHKSST